MIIISKWKDLIIHLLFFDIIVMLYVSPLSKITDEKNRLHLNSIITEKNDQIHVSQPTAFSWTRKM